MKSMRPAFARPRQQGSGRRAVLGAIAVGTLALGAALAGAVPASAASGSVAPGLITLGSGNPIASVAVNADLQTQLRASDPALGNAYFNGEAAGASGTSIYVVASDDTQKVTSNPQQTFGGTGTAADPFWIQTTRTAPGSYAVTKRDSYVLGDDFVKTDLSYENLSAAASNVALNSYADCMLGGSDTGLAEVVDGRASCKGGASGPFISFISAEPGATFAAGDYSAVRQLAWLYAPLPNGCVPLAACNSRYDNGLAVSFRVSAAAGERVTKTYYSTYSSNLALAKVVPDVSVSQSQLSVGDDVVFSLSLANQGPSDATNAGAVFQLPQGFQFVGATGEGSYDGATGTWTVGDLVLGDAARIQITARASAAGQYRVGIASAGSDVMNPEPCSAVGGANCGSVQTITVSQTLDLSRSTLDLSPATAVADGASFATVTVRLFDAVGGPITGTHTVTISSAIGIVGAVTQNSDGSYSAQVTSTAVGQGAVTFSVDGAAGPKTETVSFISGPVDFANSTTSVSTGTRIADGVEAHTITATIKDAHGNPVLGQSGNIAAATAALLGRGAISSFSETTPGTYVATISSTVSGAKDVTVTLGGSNLNPFAVTGAGNTVATFVAGPVDPSNSGTGFSVSTGSRMIHDGSHELRVTLVDSFGNPVTGSADLLSGTSSASLGSGTISRFEEDPDAPGTYVSAVTSSVAVVTEISVTHDGTALIAHGNAEAQFVGDVAAVVTPPSPAKSTAIESLASTGSDVHLSLGVAASAILVGGFGLLTMIGRRRLQS